MRELVRYERFFNSQIFRSQNIVGNVRLLDPIFKTSQLHESGNKCSKLGFYNTFPRGARIALPYDEGEEVLFNYIGPGHNFSCAKSYEIRFTRAS